MILLISFPAYSVTDKDFINECKNGNKEMVVKMIKNGADINATDMLKWTPLHWAAFRGHLDVAELLIAEGSNVQAAAKNGSTPLNLAIHSKHNDIVNLLYKNGAVNRAPHFMPRAYQNNTWTSNPPGRVKATYGTSNRTVYFRPKPVPRGLIIKLISVVGNANRRMAMIDCNGSIDDYFKGDVKTGKFKVVEILQDSVVVYLTATRQHKTIRLPY